MNPEILAPILWSFAGVAGFYAVQKLQQHLAKRRRQKAKPWRISAEPPKLPVAHQQKTVASLGKGPVRKTTARIGVKRKTRR